MSKTPVMVLQELMVKMGTKGLPVYTTTNNGGGTNQNCFTIRVTCGEHTAFGSGSSKKYAKHEAAKAMLAQMGVNTFQHAPAATPPQSPPLPSAAIQQEKSQETATSPGQPAEVQSSDSQFVNAIGILQEMFVLNKLKQPTYLESCTEGPPHIRVFTIQCRVGDVVEEGVGRTKKQAKQNAALKMLQHVRGRVLSKELSHLSDRERQLAAVALQSEEPSSLQMKDLEIEEPTMPIAEANKLAMARYSELSHLPVTEKSSILISTFHRHLKTSYDDKTRCAIIGSLDFMIDETKKSSMQSFDQLKVAFRKLLKALNLNYDRKIFKTMQPSDKLLIAIKLNSKPAIVEVGYDESEDRAEREAILRSLKALKLLLK